MRKVPALYQLSNNSKSNNQEGEESNLDIESRNVRSNSNVSTRTNLTTKTNRTARTTRTNNEEFKDDSEYELVAPMNRDELVETYKEEAIEDEWLKHIESEVDYDAFKNQKDLDPHFVRGGVFNILATALPESPSYDSHELQRTGLMIPLAILYFLSYFGAILYFSITEAIDTSKHKFLSLDNVNDKSIRCSEVPNFIINKYASDINGYWQSDPNFFSNGSNYEINFEGTSITTDQYKNIMETFDKNLLALGNRGKLRDMAWNLVALSTYRFKDDDANMEFSTVSTPLSIFNVAVQTANYFTRLGGMCKDDSRIYGRFESPYITVYTPNKMNETDYSETNFMSYNFNVKIPCHDYITSSMIPNFQLMLLRPGWSRTEFDVRSLTAAIAINVGILELELMATTVSTYPGLVKLPAGSFYMDPYYRDVNPFYCLDKQNPGSTGPGSNLCFLLSGGFNAGQTVLLPWAVSLNYEDMNGPMCSCPDMSHASSCNQMDVIFLIFYDMDRNETQASLNTIALGKKFQKMMWEDQESGDIKVSELLYPLARSAAALYLDPSNVDHEDAVKAAFDSFCITQTCGAVVVESTPYSYFNPINPQNLQVASLTNIEFEIAPSFYNGFISKSKQSMCTDYIHLPDAMLKMKNSYPTSLVNDYYECHNTFSYAFFSSIGSAAGTASLFCAIFLPLMTYLMGHVYNKLKKNKKLYSINEKRRLDEMIAIRSKYALNSVVEGLVDELVILRHENIDNRRIISQLLNVNSDKLKSSEYVEFLESIKQRKIPDAALQHELMAFKRYFINQKREALLEAKRVRVTGRPIEHDELEKLNIEKAQALHDSLNPTKRVRLKKKKSNPLELDIREDANQTSNSDSALSLLSWFGYYEK